MAFPLIGGLLLAGRAVSLGLERPAFKALARERHSVAATTLTYSLALLLLVPVLVGAALSGSEQWRQLAQWWPYALISGLVGFVGYNANMAALGRGDVSLLGPLYSTGLVWLYVLEVAFGGARFHPLQLGGILLTAVGMTLLGLPPGRRIELAAFSPHRVLRAPGAGLMLASALLLGVTRLVDKLAAGTAPPLSYAALATIPVAGLSLLLLAARGQVRSPANLLRERPAAALGSAAAHISGHLILLGAYRYFNASVVEPVGQLSLFVNIAIGAWWFREPVRDRWVPGALIAAGAALVLMYR